MDKFIEYDNHNGIVLLKAAIMNALHKVMNNRNVEINLEYIPVGLLIGCLEDSDLEYKLEWNRFEYTIDIYLNNNKIVLINGDVGEIYTKLRNIEDTRISR